MRVADVMTRGVECAGPDMTLQAAGRLMAEHDVGALPVVCDGEAIGILTDRDIVVRALSQGHNPALTRVEDIMSGELASCGPDDHVDDAASIMEQRRVRRLLVVDHEGCVCGIVSLGDLAVRNDEPQIAEEVLEYVSWPGHAHHQIHDSAARARNGRAMVRRFTKHEAILGNSKSGSLGSTIWPALVGLAAGIATMYMFDPGRGARRRALVRDKVIHASHVAQRALGKSARHAGNRARGFAAHAWNRFKPDDFDSIVLTERVRSALGRAVSHPHAIEVSADEDGDVTLRGIVLERDLDALLDAVRGVRGVRSVHPMLDVRRYGGNEQGGRLANR